MADLHGKYQILATEYAKLKSQIPVLKKAVIDEQAKEAQLKEAILEKEQSVRRHEQEIESLTFRNQQLSKRVTVLQDELDKMAVSGRKKGRSDSSAGLQLLASADGGGAGNRVGGGGGVLGEELQQKIAENEALHRRLAELERRRELELSELREASAAELAAERARREGELAAAAAERGRALAERLVEEKALLEARLQLQEQALRDAEQRCSAAELRAAEIESDIGTKLAEASKTIREKVVFNDTRSRNLNALNVPTHDRRFQQRSREHLQLFHAAVRDVTRGLADAFAYLEQRLLSYPVAQPEPPSLVSRKLCSHLRCGPETAKALEESFRKFQEELRDDSLTMLETAVGVHDVAIRFSGLSSYVSKIVPYMVLSSEEESAVPSCPAGLQQKNREAVAALERLSAAMQTVDSHLALLAAQSSKPNDHPKTSQARMLRLLASSLVHLHQTCTELLVAYTGKVQLEKQLPTLPRSLLATNDCLLTAMAALANGAGKLSSLMSDNVELYTGAVGYRTRGSSVSTNESELGPKYDPAVSEFRQRAAEYIRSLQRSCPPSVPYAVALENSRTLFSTTESRESLSEQLTKLREKNAELEREKEHWLLEAQMLKMKHDVERSRAVQLERLQDSKLDGMGETIDSNVTRPSSQQKRTASDLDAGSSTALGQVDSERPSTAQASESGDLARLHEDLLRSHYARRIGELTAQLQLVDGKATHFNAECKALSRRLQLANRARDQAIGEHSDAMATIAALQDELQTTKKNYDAQLSSMSEALAAMNDSITRQQDHIEELKLQLKEAKKGKR